jgi:phospholipid-binding lipoprotein MlaA
MVVKSSLSLGILIFISVLFISCATQQTVDSSSKSADNVDVTISIVTASIENIDAVEADNLDDDFELDDFSDEFTESEPVYDPLSGYNYFMTDVNDWLYLNIFDPTARGYNVIMPQVARLGISNFFSNLLFPKRFINNLLQLKFSNAGQELLRFIINTSIGVFGVWDAAESLFGMQSRPEDFGQTLAFYGVGAGPHIVLPFFGPSNLRDTLSMSADWGISSYAYENLYQVDLTLSQRILLRAFKEVNYFSLNLGIYQSIKQDAFDLYLFLRDSYEQKRLTEINQ